LAVTLKVALEPAVTMRGLGWLEMLGGGGVVTVAASTALAAMKARARRRTRRRTEYMEGRDLTMRRIGSGKERTSE
jgi:hypothetical protein